MRGVAVKTPERVAEAQQMRADGMLLREIGAVFGVSLKTVDGWLCDPDGRALRARKDSYAQPCMDCGGATSGSEGRRAEPRCHACAMAHLDRTFWTRDALICAIQEWAHEHGEPPAMPDWNPYTARNYLHDEERARRFEAADGAWPSFKTVVDCFGTWNAGIAAAGFAPRAAGGGGPNAERRRARSSTPPRASGA